MAYIPDDTELTGAMGSPQNPAQNNALNQMGMGGGVGFGQDYGQTLLGLIQSNSQNPQFQQALLGQYLDYINPVNQMQMQQAYNDMNMMNGQIGDYGMGGGDMMGYTQGNYGINQETPVPEIEVPDEPSGDSSGATGWTKSLFENRIGSIPMMGIAGIGDLMSGQNPRAEGSMSRSTAEQFNPLGYNTLVGAGDQIAQYLPHNVIKNIWNRK